MRSRLLALVLAALALLGACGGDDGGDRDPEAGDETTTSTSTGGGTGSTVPEAKPASVAYVVLQFDDALRPKVVDAAPCLHGPYDECEGGSLDAYDDIEVLARSVGTILPQLSDEASDLYYGRMSGDLTARLDATINAGAAAKTAADAALDTCLPDFPPECDAANEELDAALIDLFKIFNAWRDLA